LIILSYKKREKRMELGKKNIHVNKFALTIKKDAALRGAS
jgi:hypothetical protein